MGIINVLWLRWGGDISFHKIQPEHYSLTCYMPPISQSRGYSQILSTVRVSDFLFADSAGHAP